VSAVAVLDLGRRSFGEVEALQEATRARVLAGLSGEERVFLVEHDPVVTLGRRSDERALRVPTAALTARGVAIHRASRGGEATYHGPGQIVAYPIVVLRRGVVAHVEALGESVVQVARAVGVEARFERARVGVWVGARKLAAIGVHVRRRVAIHGIALNVAATASAGFASIVPCGMPDVEATSLEQEGARVGLDDVRRALGEALLRCLPGAA
jgi:lipoate-protein ligase B